MELGEMVLSSNEFTFEGERYRQKEGMAVGSKMGKNYACTYMGKWEEEVNGRAEMEIGRTQGLVSVYRRHMGNMERKQRGIHEVCGGMQWT